MMNIISERRSITGLSITLSILVLFHLLIMLEVIPFDIVWGDRLKDKSQMLRFEITSVIINFIMLGVVAIKAGVLKVGINNLVINVMLWIMSGLFFMNVFGNLLSNNNFERIVFTPITIFLLVCSLRLAIGARPPKH